MLLRMRQAESAAALSTGDIGMVVRKPGGQKVPVCTKLGGLHANAERGVKERIEGVQGRGEGRAGGASASPAASTACTVIASPSAC